MEQEEVKALKIRVNKLESENKLLNKKVVYLESATKTFNSLFEKKNKEIFSLIRSIKTLETALNSLINSRGQR